MDKKQTLKIAITHDYLTEYGGAELVLWELLKIFPDADLYTSLYKPNKKQRDFWTEVSHHKVHTSGTNSIPLIRKFRKLLLGRSIAYFRSLDLNSYDVVISSSSNFAKFLNLEKKTKHIAYIHTPPRFLWGYETSTFHKIPSVGRILLNPIIAKWKKLDKYYAGRADIVVANSIHIQQEIKKCYGIDAEVIYPPVLIDRIINAKPEKKQNFFITVSRLQRYKRIDLIIKAFNKLNKKLLVVGDGPDKERLEKLAGKNIQFYGFTEEQTKIKLLKEARGFIFAGHEDFGIVMVEALAAGTPVIAYEKGGALEIIEQGRNGIFFDKQNTKSLSDAVKKLYDVNFRTDTIINSSKKFSSHEFANAIKGIVSSVVRAK